MELRTINLSDKHFECGGRKFFVKDTLSFARYRELQKLNLEFGFSATFIDIFKNIEEAWNLLNKVKLAEAAVILYNIMHGLSTLDDKDDAGLRMCALFIDEAGEDPTIYNEAKMKDKIDCWASELDVTPFFQFAVSLVPGWKPAYINGTRNISSQEKAEVST